MNWKKHPQFNVYEISDTGLVRSLSRSVCCKGGKFRVHQGKQLTLVPKEHGYVEVAICIGGKRFYKRVNRLVLETFVGDGTGKVCRHLDGSRSNNVLSNLAWGTHKENSEDMVVHGRSTTGAKNGMNLHPESRSPGEKNGSAKLNAVDVERIRDIRRSGASYSDLVSWFQISKTQISRICTGASWR